MSQENYRRMRSTRPGVTHAAMVGAALIVAFGTAACRTPYRYAYEKKTGVGLTDRANDYCQRSAVKEGYASVRGSGPNTVDSPSQVDVRMRVTDREGELFVSCAFDDARRTATIPHPQRGDVKRGELGFNTADAKQARTVCDRAVSSSGYDAREISVAQWTGGRQYRVNVSVRQGGADRNVACRFDAVAGTASVPPVTR